jgi:death on curing protein
MAEEDLEYLDADDIIALHGLALGRSAQRAADQLRSRTTLEGAVARPMWHAVYSGADVAMQAAVLAHGVAESQSFVDGNKRTAWVALRTFLVINGWDIDVSQAERAAWILDLCRGGTAEALADRIRTALHPAASP